MNSLIPFVSTHFRYKWPVLKHTPVTPGKVYEITRWETGVYTFFFYINDSGVEAAFWTGYEGVEDYSFCVNLEKILE